MKGIHLLSFYETANFFHELRIFFFLYRISKYHSRPHDLKLLIYTAMLLYNDQKQATEKD